MYTHIHCTHTHHLDRGSRLDWGCDLILSSWALVDTTLEELGEAIGTPDCIGKRYQYAIKME